MRSDAKAIEHDHVMGDVILDGRIESHHLSEHGTNRAEVAESSLANSVTSCPCRTSSSVRCAKQPARFRHKV